MQFSLQNDERPLLYLPQGSTEIILESVAFL